MNETQTIEKSKAQRVIENPEGYTSNTFFRAVLKEVRERYSQLLKQGDTKKSPTFEINDSGAIPEQEYTLYQIKIECSFRRPFPFFARKKRWIASERVEPIATVNYNGEIGERVLTILSNNSKLVKACQDVVDMANGSLRGNLPQ